MLSLLLKTGSWDEEALGYRLCVLPVSFGEWPGRRSGLFTFPDQDCLVISYSLENYIEREVPECRPTHRMPRWVLIPGACRRGSWIIWNSLDLGIAVQRGCRSWCCSLVGGCPLLMVLCLVLLVRDSLSLGWS